MTFSRFFPVATAAAMICSVSTAHAFSLLTPTRSWDTVPVSIGVMNDSVSPETSIGSPDPDFGVTAITNALNGGVGWNGAAPGLVHAYSATSWSLNDAEPTIVFNDPLGICAGSCLAATMIGSYYLSGGTGVIQDADVFVSRRATVRFDSELERRPMRCAGSYYIEGVIMHEVGHVLGLDHSSDPAATMFATVDPCNDRLDAITADDIAGLATLY
jgi:hypothetical protein